MSGYVWAKTGQNELLVVLLQSGKGFVPGVENAIDLGEITILEPVRWPSQLETPSPTSAQPNCGARAADATRECVILPFAANG